MRAKALGKEGETVTLIMQPSRKQVPKSPGSSPFSAADDVFLLLGDLNGVNR